MKIQSRNQGVWEIEGKCLTKEGEWLLGRVIKSFKEKLRFHCDFKVINKHTGVSTLRSSVSGEKQNSSGNLKILPGIGGLEKFSRRHKAKELKFWGFWGKFLPDMRDDIPNFQERFSFTHGTAQTAFVWAVTPTSPPSKSSLSVPNRHHHLSCFPPSPNCSVCGCYLCF